MKTDLEKRLKEAFEIPEPLKKKQFLKQVRECRPEISSAGFVLIQASYIRKRTWVISAAVLLAAWYGAFFVDREMLWVICGLLPFVAATAVAENMRSVDYGMAELEMASCFSIKSVLLARMGILSLVHLALLLALMPIGSIHHVYTLFQSGIYLVVPYLFTTVVDLEITRRIHGQESTFACLGAAVMISGLSFIMKLKWELLYQEAFLGWWAAALAVLTVLTVREYQKMIRQTEELTWKLS